MDEFTGTVMIVAFSFASSTVVLKRIFKYVPAILKKPVKLVIKHHKKIGLFTVLLLLSHFLLTVFSQEDEIASGLFAGGLMIAQITSGILLSKSKGKTRKVVLWVHRIITFILLIAILIHVD